jgi:hypothetical protein
MDFQKIAPYLSNPLVLIGFGLLLFFGLHRVLVKSKILPEVSATDSNKIVRLLLHYGFIVAVLVVLLGFGIEALKQILQADEVRERSHALATHPLTRTSTEEILQTHRASIEQCIEKHPDWTFLNFAIDGRPDGGLNIDVLAGEQRTDTLSLGHIHIPPGQYTHQQFQVLLTNNEMLPEQKEWLKIGLDFENASPDAMYWSNGRQIYFSRDIGRKLSIAEPKTNLCILSVVNGSFAAFSGTFGNQPIIHRYITNVGVNTSKKR